MLKFELKQEFKSDNQLDQEIFNDVREAIEEHLKHQGYNNLKDVLIELLDNMNFQQWNDEENTLESNISFLNRHCEYNENSLDDSILLNDEELKNVNMFNLQSALKDKVRINFDKYFNVYEKVELPKRGQEETINFILITIV